MLEIHIVLRSARLYVFSAGMRSCVASWELPKGYIFNQSGFFSLSYDAATKVIDDLERLAQRAI